MSPPQENKLPFHDVHIDEDELFTQLCVAVRVARVLPDGPKGEFLNLTSVGEQHEHQQLVVRVWREWLSASMERQASWEEEHGPGYQRSGLQGDAQVDESILWAGIAQHVGLRFRAVETSVADDEANRDGTMPAWYRLEHRELLVRSSCLMLALERSWNHTSVPALGAVMLTSR